MKDPLEQVEVPLMRPIFWGALAAAVLVVYAIVFPQALTWGRRDPRAAGHHLPPRARALRHREAHRDEGE
ncbi:MAG: hypothetical protein KatS3mg010_0554 [Acidimicrobiia bacterium]|nr:MAG: hypothetical protein KatS3mg010_0554 [Acidimicrobiia bacterium]